MSFTKLWRPAAAAALSVLLLGAGQGMAAEVTIKSVSPWSKSHRLTKSFLRFIKKTNEVGKGTV